MLLKNITCGLSQPTNILVHVIFYKVLDRAVIKREGLLRLRQRKVPCS